MLNEKLEVKVVEDTFFKSFADNTLEYDWSSLPHYFDDEDIRSKDDEYKKFQNTELSKLIHFLRTEDILKANQISFLQSTTDL